MANLLFYPAGSSAACRCAQTFLEARGLPFIGHISPEITHLLLDVPSLLSGAETEKLLHMLPGRITVIGGNLHSPILEGYKTQDLLQDAEYLAQNAFITADCALQVAAPLLTTTLRDTPTLIIGWGRIGKCLAQLLKAAGAEVSVAARKEADRAMIRALGYQAVKLSDRLSGFRLLYNTAPEPVLAVEKSGLCKNCVKIDLASKRGIMGEDVVWARGLPGVHAPESSGRLISDTILRMIGEETA